jgi:hypothetical protein
MQPEPTELSTPAPTLNNSSERVDASQYGFLANQLPSADARVSPLDERAASAGPGAAPDESGTRSPGRAELQEQLGRLNLDDSNETRPKPSFQLISEYENALLPSTPRKHNEGPGFKVVKKQSSTLDGPQLENFPNGNFPSTRPSTPLHKAILRIMSVFLVAVCSNAQQRF